MVSGTMAAVHMLHQLLLIKEHEPPEISQSMVEKLIQPALFGIV